VGYMRRSDLVAGAGMTLIAPVGMTLMERVSPSYAGRGGFTSVLRTSWFLGLCGGAFLAYQRSLSLSTYVLTHMLPTSNHLPPF
jgi:hypothetical protein